MATRMSDEQRWAIVQSKDRRYDGTFVIGVKTTGVYCRPSCPARLPLRQNVAFFDAPDGARAAGFRPCKRCSPDSQAFEARLTEQVCRMIEGRAEAGERVTLSDLADEANVSPTHLARVFKRAIGITPRQYAETKRLDALKARIKEGEPVTQALYAAGYGSSSRLYERAPERMGMTPGEYGRGGLGKQISYTVRACPLGYVLVAATERGICAVSLGDAPETLVETLRGDYPAAELSDDSEGLGEWVSAVLGYLDGHQPHLELPLDVQATAFQKRVWDALRAIPYGETRTYSQVAASIGQPTAARAVARACATNQAALVVPCHRVVREDGDLGGYRWGMWRKEQLLERERGA